MALLWGKNIVDFWPTGLWSGILFGLLFGAIMAAFLQVDEIVIPFQENGTNIELIKQELAAIGYKLKSEMNEQLIYRPGFKVGLLSGDVDIVVLSNSAIVRGPSMYLKKLQSRLSV